MCVCSHLDSRFRPQAPPPWSRRRWRPVTQRPAASPWRRRVPPSSRRTQLPALRLARGGRSGSFALRRRYVAALWPSWPPTRSPPCRRTPLRGLPCHFGAGGPAAGAGGRSMSSRWRPTPAAQRAEVRAMVMLARKCGGSPSPTRLPRATASPPLLPRPAPALGTSARPALQAWAARLTMEHARLPMSAPLRRSTSGIGPGMRGAGGIGRMERRRRAPRLAPRPRGGDPALLSGPARALVTGSARPAAITSSRGTCAAGDARRSLQADFGEPPPHAVVCASGRRARLELPAAGGRASGPAAAAYAEPALCAPWL